MPEIPDNAAYLITGLIVGFSIISVFIVSLVIRFRNLKKNIQFVEQFSEEA